MATHLRKRREGDVLYLSFYEEEVRKPCTLDYVVLGELEAAVAAVEADAGVLTAIVVSSESPKSFVVGANIAALRTLDQTNIRHWVRNGHRIFARLQALPVPVICKVTAFALGGGLELAMSCDFIIAGENAKFGQPEASLGVMPGWGGSYRLPMLIGPARAKQMFMTGKPIDAATALAWGLINEVVAEERVDERIGQIIEDIRGNDGNVLAMTKEIIHHQCLESVPDNTFKEEITSSVAMASTTTQQRLAAFFEKRAAKKKN